MRFFRSHRESNWKYKELYWIQECHGEYFREYISTVSDERFDLVCRCIPTQKTLKDVLYRKIWPFPCFYFRVVQSKIENQKRLRIVRIPVMNKKYVNVLYTHPPLQHGVYRRVFVYHYRCWSRPCVIRIRHPRPQERLCSTDSTLCLQS